MPNAKKNHCVFLGQLIIENIIPLLILKVKRETTECTPKKGTSKVNMKRKKGNLKRKEKNYLLPVFHLDICIYFCTWNCLLERRTMTLDMRYNAV